VFQAAICNSRVWPWSDSISSMRVASTPDAFRSAIGSSISRSAGRCWRWRRTKGSHKADSRSWLRWILDRLEVSRWAKRHPHPGDRRARSLVITEEARALLPFVWSVVTESQRDALQGFSVDEKQFLMSALKRVLANLRLCVGAVE
jgi:hypothetical protein